MIQFFKQLSEYLMEFNMMSVCVRLILAWMMGGLIGLERGRHGRAAGLRTHILVCVGSCMTGMVGLYIHDVLGIAGDVSRIAAQVVSGIGFLGAGTILVKNHSIVTGLTTAAGVWCTATIGVALGYGFYEGAIICAIIAVITTGILTRLEVNQKIQVRCYVELRNAEETTATVDTIYKRIPTILHVDVVAAKSSLPGAVGLAVTFNKSKDSNENYLRVLDSIDNVLFAVQE